MTGQPFDIVQVGYGPVGQALAIMLGRQGHRVAVCERWTTRYPLPRAVCIDHELYRVLSANGMGAVLPSISHAGPLYQWFNAEWRELLAIDWSAGSISGGPEVNFVHQPTLEEAFHREVTKQPTVETMLGWEAVNVTQDDKLAHVKLRNSESGEERCLSARFVVGCDGANSLVRQAIGGELQDLGFEADWLVVDVLLRNGVTIETLGIPAAGQFCDPARPTTIVPAGVREGRIYRRWEFMRLPGEPIDALESEDRVWELLKPWAKPDDVELVRHKVYNFRSLLAERWWDGRLLIAGDSAHVMPPFMGQGMCAGLRDAWNLAWKLDLILGGTADARLLETYQAERMPHVRQIIDMSIYLGKIICLPDAEAAAARDQAFFENQVAPPPSFPHLIDGLLHREPCGRPSQGAGLLSPHVEVAGYGIEGRLDDVTNGGFVAIARGSDPKAQLSAATIESLDAIGASYVRLDDAEEPSALIDVDGRLEHFMTEQGWQAMLVRPDYYVYGGVAERWMLPRLVADLLADLEARGVHAAVSRARAA